jgi:hypothetical protein
MLFDARDDRTSKEAFALGFEAGSEGGDDAVDRCVHTPTTPTMPFRMSALAIFFLRAAAVLQDAA